MKAALFLAIAMASLIIPVANARAEEATAQAVFGASVAGCGIGAAVGAGVAAYGNLAKSMNGVAGGAAGGCAIGGVMLGGTAVATAAEAKEAPSEIELQPSDIQTLQDAQDLKNE